VRHSGSAPTRADLEWQLALDKEPLDAPNDACPEVFYSPEAILAIIYKPDTTGEPKGVILTHANILSNVYCLNYWMRYRQGGVYLHAAPIFHGADFPAMFAAPAFGALQVVVSGFSPRTFCEAVEKERITQTILVPAMINILTDFADATRFDLSSLEVLAYGGSPLPVEVYRRTREMLPGVKLVEVYGMTETGCLTGLKGKEDSIGQLLNSCARSCSGVDVQ
jgi:acyl-CoA synthetase (AMP-forming)/AMP-acid ligase II